MDIFSILFHSGFKTICYIVSLKYGQVHQLCNIKVSLLIMKSAIQSMKTVV